MIRILFLAATPVDQAHLRVRQEFDELRQALDSAAHGRRFTLIQEFAAAPEQLQALLFRHQPQIVHFSGHGTDGGLVFEGTDGSSHLVAPQTLHDLFAHFGQQVRCVVLNACYSESQAAAIATVIDSVVGMSDALTDDAAIAFAVAFHRALANGTTLADAVALGRNQLDLQGLDEAHKPQLLADRIDAAQVRALDWDDTPLTDSQEALLFVPFPRKTATEFVGRDAELVELHAKLQQSQIVGVRPAAALTGLGGIGKTQLAVEYAYRYQASYPGGIFWINAADFNRVRAQLVETAERMGLRNDYNTTDNALLARLVKRCQQQPATLLCFDNAPDAVILWRRLTQELNTATLGASILITTRRRELPPTMAALDLRRLSDNTVRQFLATVRPDLLIDPDLPRLLERLGGLPLVVSLVANALRNSPDATIADYLATLAEHGEEAVHEALDVHVEDYDLYHAVYTRTLLPVLREQWERLCQQPKSENAQLLLRIAGQLPEAAEISISRLGLLAGLRDEKVIKPLANAIQTLWKLALIEELKADAIRLHLLVREFATTLTAAEECAPFGTACAQRMVTAYSDLQRLGQEYAQRGIGALLVDLLTAIDLAQPTASTPQSPVAILQSLLRHLRLASNHLQDSTAEWQPQHLWQQLLLVAALTRTNEITQRLTNLLRQTRYWLPQWSQLRQSVALEQTLVGHAGWVNSVVVLDAQRIVSAADDCTLKIWNFDTGQLEQTLTGHADRVLSVTVLDEQRIVSASSDRTLKIWNLTTGQLEQTLAGHAEGVLSVTLLDKQHIISAASDRTLKVWNLATGQLEQTLIGHADWVNSVAVLDDQRIVSTSWDRTLKVWNLATGQLEQTLTGHENLVLSVAVLDAQRIVSASSDRTLKIWNLATGQLEQTLIGHENWVNSVAVLDDQRIVSASSDRTLKVWNFATGQPEQTLAGHADRVLSVAMLDDQRIVSASSDRTLKVWNLATGQLEQTFAGHADRVLSVTVLDNQHIVSAADDGTLKIWNLATGQLEQTLIGHENWVNSVAVLDDQRIVSAADDRTLKVWNLTTSQLEQTLTGHKDGVLSVAVLDEQRIISTSYDRTLKVWNLTTGQLEQTLTGHKDGVLSVAVLDEQRIVSASYDGTLKVWNLTTGQLEQTLTSHADGVLSVAVLDEQRIVSASSDGTLKVWNLTTGQLEQTLTGHTDWVRSVAVLDEQRIVSAGDDRTLKAWDLTTGQVSAEIGLDGAPQCVAVARQDGRTLVVAGDAGGALYCLELVEPMEP